MIGIALTPDVGWWPLLFVAVRIRIRNLPETGGPIMRGLVKSKRTGREGSPGDREQSSGLWGGGVPANRF
jgi:hypothetical protein